MIAVRCYLRYGLFYRDVEELLAARSIVVDHVSVYRWVALVPIFARSLVTGRIASRWSSQETCVNVSLKRISNDVGWTATVPANGLFRSLMNNIVAIKKAAKAP
jgi:transposase-like protein